MQKDIISNKNFTRQQAVELRDEVLWRTLSNIPLSEAVSQFLVNFGEHTQRSYANSFEAFFKLGILHPTMNLQALSLMNLEGVVDMIRERIKGSEATKQARCASFISFTAFLNRKTSGMIRKAIPSKEKATKTFAKIRNTATTEALSERQWILFIEALKALNYRDHLIAKATLQGAKRIDEVLSSKISQINWDKRTITFKQSKAEALEKTTVISYPENFISELKEYIGNKKEGYIFTTRLDKKVTQQHIYRSFVLTGIRAGLSIKVTPHTLRATGITMLASKGFSTDQILKISGHADSRYVTYYDKTSFEDNISKEVSLI